MNHEEHTVFGDALRSLKADITKAQKLGPVLARLTDAEKASEAKVGAILTPYKKAVLAQLQRLNTPLCSWEMVWPNEPEADEPFIVDKN